MPTMTTPSISDDEDGVLLKQDGNILKQDGNILKQDGETCATTPQSSISSDAQQATNGTTMNGTLNGTMNGTIMNGSTERSHAPLTSGTSISVSSVSTSSQREVGITDGKSSNLAARRRRNYYYLSPSAVAELPNYKYQGEDLSYVYKYVLSPLAGWLVEHVTPATVAPNAITLWGLGWMVASYGLVWYYCPGLHEASDSFTAFAVPRWIFLFNAVAMLVYQTLDNMDGKQARKTGSSSPLGLLFDHGCDAINLILGSGNWMAAMALYPSDCSHSTHCQTFLAQTIGGDVTTAYLLILCPMIAFYVSTWEQYYTGKLLLPVFNGPSEGLLMGATLSAISFFMGPMFWQATSITDRIAPSYPMRNLDWVLLSTVLALIQEVTIKTSFVIRTYGYHTIRTLIPHIILVIASAMLLHHDPTLLLRRPRTTMHLISGLFVEQATQLMLDHMVKEDYKLCRWALLPLAIFTLTSSTCSTCNPLSTEAMDAFLLAYATAIWVYLAFKIRVAVYEICDVLAIWCFDIVTPHPNAKNVICEETESQEMEQDNDDHEGNNDNDDDDNDAMGRIMGALVVGLDDTKCINLNTKKIN